MLKYSLSFDDGADYDMRIADLLASYNLTATFYIPVNWESYASQKGWTPITKSQLIDLSNHFEIGSHTLNHYPLTRVPFSVAQWEIVQSKKQMQDLIGKPVTKFAYPRGYGSDPLRDLVRETYKYGRSTLVGTIEEQEDPAWQHTSVHVAYPRKEYNQMNWFDYGNQLLHKAVRKDGIFKAFGHSWEIHQHNGWHGLEILFKEISQYEGTPT